MWPWKKPLSRAQIDNERKIYSTNQRKEARESEKNAKKILRNESTTIKKAKKIVGSLLNDLGNAKKTDKDLIKHIKKLVDAKMGIGGYVGLVGMLVQKTNKIRDNTISKDLVKRLNALNSGLLVMVGEVNTALTTLVGCCRSKTVTNRNNVRRIAGELDNKFEKMLKFSSGIESLEIEIWEKIEEQLIT